MYTIDDNYSDDFTENDLTASEWEAAAEEAYRLELEEGVPCTLDYDSIIERAKAREAARN